MKASRLSMEQKKRFCTAWPHAKEALELILVGAPVWYVKVAIAIILAAGKTLYELTCSD